MISIVNTPNFTGVTIRGDYYDLYNLVQALYEIAISEFSEKHQEYIDMSLRVLSVCYDIRHAFMAHRDIYLVDNNMTEEKMKWHSLIVPKTNVYYSCNCLYPEMFYLMLVLNDLVKLRIKDMTKSKDVYVGALNGKAVWDETIAVIRQFQAAFAKCVKETLAPATYTRWLNLMNQNYIGLDEMLFQYLDRLNIEFIKMSRERRAKSVFTMARRIAEFRTDPEYQIMERAVFDADKEHGWHPEEVHFVDDEYPEEWEW